MMIYVNNRSPKKLRMQRKKQLAKKQEQYQEWLDDEYQLSDIWLKQAVGGME